MSGENGHTTPAAEGAPSVPAESKTDTITKTTAADAEKEAPAAGGRWYTPCADRTAEHNTAQTHFFPQPPPTA